MLVLGVVVSTHRSAIVFISVESVRGENSLAEGFLPRVIFVAPSDGLDICLLIFFLYNIPNKPNNS